jgi:hypothetical protein
LHRPGLIQAINRGYLEANQTANLIWTPIYSWYDWLFYVGKGLMSAQTPHSGYYNVTDTLWAVAHTTQFTQPGAAWECATWLSAAAAETTAYLSPLCALGWSYLVGTASGYFPALGGSFVSYLAPAGDEFSMVLETFNTSQ